MKSTPTPPLGCGNSYPTDSYPKDTLTLAASATYNPPTSTASPNAISSQASAGGHTPSSSPSGQQMSLFGPEAVPVSRSVSRGSDPENQTHGIYGPKCSDLCETASLQSALGNRLRERFALGGSMEYAETWKRKVSPSGLTYWAHTASARPISGSGCIGWPTPTAQDGSRGGLPPRPQDTGSGNVKDGHEPGRVDPKSDGSATTSGGAGHWDCFDIIHSIEGKARRVESGIHPLAHGVPGRVGLLRGYGNAIVPQVAAEFIKAFQDVTTQSK